MAGATRPYSFAIVFCLALGLAWVGWRVTDLAQQVSDLQGQVQALSDDAQAADDALAQSQEALRRVRAASDDLSDSLESLNGPNPGAALPALFRAQQALLDALSDAEDALGGEDAPADDEPADPDTLTA